MLTSHELATQWINPSDVSTILFVLGGDVVQKAYSQATGTAYVPVCFSFGCVAYAFVALVGIIGEGRLLSPPDYPCKVLNLKSGYARDNKSFVLGRLLRDLEAIETRKEARVNEENDDDGHNYALKISIFTAKFNKNDRTEFSWSWVHAVGIVITAIQLVLAFIPFIVHRTWSILLITGAGTLLVQWAGLLPQWKAEKLPNKQRSNQVYALTSGNGSRDVMVIFGHGNCLDLESLATSQSPRNGRPWEKFLSLSRPREGDDRDFSVIHRNSIPRKANRSNFGMFRGYPTGFIITQISCACLSILWLLLLINVSSRSEFPESWCLLGIGSLGMFQNAWLAARELTPEMRNIPMECVEQIKGQKVMDSIMDFHATYGLGLPLRKEFFPGEIEPDEKAWWKGEVEEYNKKRRSDGTRGTPRLMARYFEYQSVFWGEESSGVGIGSFEMSEKRPQSHKAYQDPFRVGMAEDDGGESSTAPRPPPRVATYESITETKAASVWSV